MNKEKVGLISKEVYKSLDWLFSHSPNDRGCYTDLIEDFEELEYIEKGNVLSILNHIFINNIKNKSLISDLLEESDYHDEQDNTIRNKILNTLSSNEIGIINEFIKDLDNCDEDIYTISISHLKEILEDYKDNHKHLNGNSLCKDTLKSLKGFFTDVKVYFHNGFKYKVRFLE